MKKILISLCIVLLMIGAAAAGPSTIIPGYAEEYRTSGERSIDWAISKKTGVFRGILVATDGTNPVTVSIYDNTSATGTQLIPTTVITTSASDRAQGIFLPFNVRFNNGIYVRISPANKAVYTVYFKEF